MRGPDLPQYCLNFTKFGKLILRKIIKIVATICHILKLQCTKFDFCWGSAPDPAGGVYSALPDPLAGFNGGPTSKGKKRRKYGNTSTVASIVNLVRPTTSPIVVTLSVLLNLQHDSVVRVHLRQLILVSQLVATSGECIQSLLVRIACMA